jgi:predicted nucleotidyltransferase
MYMKNASIKIKIDSLEQQLKVLKSKILTTKKKKSFSELHGIFAGKLDVPLEEIKKYQYSFKDVA